MIRAKVMSRQELFERILKSLHTCVLDDEEWPVVSRVPTPFVC